MSAKTYCPVCGFDSGCGNVPEPPGQTITEGNEPMQTPTAARKGDRIEHELMPGFPMTVEDVLPCQDRSGDRGEPHQQYEVTDPEGNKDWLCGYDVKKVS